MKVIAHSRSDVTQCLTEAGIDYFVKRKQGVFTELGLKMWGKRRADLVAFGLKGNITIAEVKSSREDYRSDDKWPTYLPYCNRFYFVLSQPYWEEDKDLVAEACKEYGVGAIVLGDSGYLTVRKKARWREMDWEIREAMMSRLIWRAATYSRRNRKRRTRRHLIINF